jgi:formylglycine-generating enzyme required for sulfatase activity/predicted Ser/Thr protein kinase
MGRHSSSHTHEVAGTSIHDAAVDEVVRAIAHAPPRTPPPDPENGTRWGDRGRYVIDRRLGRGGMGTVYLASDTLLGRQVALKVLDAGDDAEDEAHRVRLMREARLAAGLEHERVARVYDVGEHDGSAFVAMEYVRGVTLRSWMSEPHAPREILRVLGQIAEGLGVLHASGVVHRDLKPENVMLPTQGGVKLLDFGLAGHVTRPAEPEPGGTVGHAPPEGRSTSAFLGTPGYMAPEQYAGERADARADIFALGVIVCELVTGERPFKCGTMMALSRAIQEQARPLDGPAWNRFPGLGDVASRMLDRERDKRYADGAAALEALRELHPPQEVEHPPSTVRRGRRWGWIVGGLVVLVGAGLVVEPRIARERARRRALAAPPPAGMALVDVGTITIGRAQEEVDAQCAALGPKCDRDQLAAQTPARRVTVAPFYLDVHEVENRAMVAVLNAVRAKLFVAPDDDDHSMRFVRFNTGIGHDGELLLDLFPAKSGITYTPEKVYPEETYRAREGRERWPVTQVSWFAADLYCRTVGKRLPTDLEWEAAARGSNNRPFPWGDAAVRCGEVAVPADGMVPMAPGCELRGKTAQDVGAAPQDVTLEGVHDLGGNVTEWVDATFDEAVDPGARSLDVPRVVRGGSYFKSLMARTSGRMRQLPNNVAPNGGFRCASSLTATPN